MSTEFSSELPLLQANQLNCERDDRTLFADLSFELRCGELVRITGPNGSGKSTLIRILVGLSAGFEGEVSFKGQPMQRARASFYDALLYLGHQVGVKASLSPEENLSSIEPETSQQAIYDALEKVGLKGFEDVPSQSLSAGQQRRVALARLYLQSKPIWILDEPFTAIDQSGVEQLEQLLIEHSHKGGLVILTTHHQLSVPHKEITLGAV